MLLSELIAQRIRNLLKVKKWTRYYLARQAGIPCSTLYYTLKAQGKSIKSTTLINICRGFNITISDFFNDNLFDLENIADED